MFLCCTGRKVQSFPPIQIFPESGRSSPANTLRRVDFPEPDSPTNATNPLFGISKLIP